MAPLPRLVIVSGAPGSGKTTLATLLARALAVPLLAKDDVKEAIANAIPAKDRTESRRLGLAAYRVLYLIASRILESGTSLVLESNFPHGLAEDHLAPLVAKSRAVQVHCQLPDALALERYKTTGRKRHAPRSSHG